jgi:hypothetical protein
MKYNEANECSRLTNRVLFIKDLAKKHGVAPFQEQTREMREINNPILFNLLLKES